MYPKLIVPFEVVPFEIMTKRESQIYFEWFISEIPTRIATLNSFYVKTTGTSGDKLDLSQESLIELWNWFIPKISVVKKTEEELENEVSMAPDWLRDELIKKNQKFSDETSSIIIDLGIYFGTVFLTSNVNLKWGVIHKPKSYVYVNQPVITGFRNSELNPISIVYNSSLKQLRNTGNEKQLFDVFNTWKEFVI